MIYYCIVLQVGENLKFWDNKRKSFEEYLERATLYKSRLEDYSWKILLDDYNYCKNISEEGRIIIKCLRMIPDGELAIPVLEVLAKGEYQK